MVCEAESNDNLYAEIFNTLGLFNCCFIWDVVYCGFFDVLVFAVSE